MADKRVTGGKNGKDTAGAPEGYSIKAQRKRGDGWAKKEKDNIVEGRLVGMFMKDSDDGPKAVFHIETIRPCKCTVGAGDETEEKVLEPGSIVNADGAVFADLERYVHNGGVYDVYFKFTHKVKVGKGNMWTGDGPFLKVIKEPPAGWERRYEETKKRQMAQASRGRATVDDSDIPF